jgi:glycosyltransferase involved in cell wall biosynthesis
MNPAVSVLMPVWNPDPEFFRVAVQSVLSQTWDDFELIVIEDPSERSAGDLLIPLNDRRIEHCIQSRRTSIVEQLNVGLARCRADLVARFDADDICRPERLERQRRFLETHHDVSVLGSQLIVINDRGEEIGHRRYPQGHDEILRHFQRSNPLAHPSVMFRRTVVAEAGGYRGVQLPTGAVPWCQDYELWSRLAGQGVRFANHPDPLVAYRLHSAQVKSTNLRDVLRAYLEIKKHYWLPTMDRPARLRWWAERILLGLPPSWVVALFHRLELVSATRERSPQ